MKNQLEGQKEYQKIDEEMNVVALLGMIKKVAIDATEIPTNTGCKSMETIGNGSTTSG
jgi:hypothetical protein